MLKIQGKGVSDGIAIGRLLFFHRQGAAVTRYAVADTDAEWQRFLTAQAKAVEELGKLAEKARMEAGDEAALLFETHQMMAEDLDYVDAIQEMIQGGLNAEAAVNDTGDQFSAMFADMDDDYMKARSVDVLDISRRITGILQGVSQNLLESISEPVILFADDLTPSETVQLDKEKLLGFITAAGSASGHTAILARTMGIPAVISVGDALKPEHEGLEVMIDGTTGEVVLEAELQVREAMLQRQAEQRSFKELLQTLKGKEDVTLDGRKMKVFCNIGGPDDISAVKANDGGGIGLFRSEFLYLACEDYPKEEQLFEAYRRAAADMEGKTVIIRTLDIGADKQVGYFQLEKEENPAMGMRALRICLTRPEVFRTQLRALYRASAYGKLGIMFPMITSVWEFRECRRACQEVQKELSEEGIDFDPNVELGVMIETPAAVLISDRLAREADFFSIGTNDLTQYTLACDRQSANLGRFYDPHHPAVLRAIQMVTENAHKYGKWVGICGELGADLELTELFLAIGVDELSVTPSRVLPLRNIIRNTDTGKNREKLLADLAGDTE